MRSMPGRAGALWTGARTGERIDLTALFQRYNASGFLFDRLNPATRINSLPLGYTDDEGTDAADATTDPIGLALDRSKGLALGAELLGSPLPSGTGWSGTASASDDDITFSAQYQSRVEYTTTVESSFYLFEFTVAAGTGNTNVVMYYNGSPTNYNGGGNYSGHNITLTGTPTRHSVIVRGKTGGGVVEFGVQDRNASGHGTMQLYDATVREIPGNHARQSTDASRVVLTSASPYWYWAGDGSADHLTTSFNPGSAGTLAACFRAAAASDDIIAAYAAASANPIALGINSSGYVEGRVGTTTVAGSTDVRGSDTVALLAYNGSDVILEVNGAQVDSDSFGGSLTSNGLYIGAGNVNGTAGSHLNGRIYAGLGAAALFNAPDRLLSQRQLGRTAGLVI